MVLRGCVGAIVEPMPAASFVRCVRAARWVRNERTCTRVVIPRVVNTVPSIDYVHTNYTYYYDYKDYTITK